ncbi:hypothetical protein PHYBOEH_007421 [Phytophthora boehmeriae]|uniref:Uncharacterized protein n=1 Tax=Phytophthora boehmeriae TaxID=109152 RepID=A0A8T1W865_9STRA|nr:hypothetical protein PHYBOEH_007421 [Phytophthora boehmeriae]
MLSAKGFLRLASALVGLMLFVVGCIGFNTLKSSNYNFESQTQFGCLCFLAVCFGLLLVFGESKLETFFFFFGFMRYRFGRACVFAVSGVMTALLGKTRNTQCNCNDNVILIIEGIALMVMTVLQLMAIFVFGNNSAGKPNPSTRTPNAVSLPVRTPLTKDSANFQPVIIQPVVQAPPAQPTPVQPSEAPAHDNNLPSWMHTQ